jgi:cytoskeleton protein RodZ
VFEIGSSLREARLRQGLDFVEIEQATKIRGKHLRALEDEQFDLLPAQTYVKGFLRTYAEYLGLDGQLYVDEFNSRYATGEEDAPPVTRSRPSRPPRRVESRAVVLALVGIAIVTALVIAAFRSGGGDEQRVATPPPPTTTKKQQKRERPRRAAPRRVTLVLTAANGSSWVQAHAGSAAGRQLYQGTLEPGQAQRLRAPRRIWLNVGQPASLTWKLNGRRRPAPGLEEGFFVVTAKRGIVRTLPAG